MIALRVTATSPAGREDPHVSSCEVTLVLVTPAPAMILVLAVE